MGVLKSELFIHATENAREGGNASEETMNSPSWKNMPDVNARLEQCATLDSHNIKPAPKAKGPHVTMIHIALEFLSKARTLPVPPPGAPETAKDRTARKYNAGVKACKANPIADAEQKASEYGPSTAKAAHAYKIARDIKAQNKPVNNVVGIMTIKTLDIDIQIANGADPPATPTEEPTFPPKFVDVIAAISMLQHRDDVKTVEQLEEYVRNRVESTDYKAKKDRILRIIPAFGDPEQFSLERVVSSLKSVPLKEGQQLGNVMIYGISFGGLKAIEVAQAVSGTTPLAYVGLADVAFHHADTNPEVRPEGQTEVGSRSGPATNTPLMKSSFSVTANKKLNVYQTKGNRFKVIGGFGQRMWSSFMAGDEIHGDIPGFPFVNVNNSCVQTDATKLHVEAARMAEDDFILRDMRLILAGNETPKATLSVQGRLPSMVPPSRAFSMRTMSTR